MYTICQHIPVITWIATWFGRACGLQMPSRMLKLLCYMQAVQASTDVTGILAPSDVMLDPILDKGQRTVGTFCTHVPVNHLKSKIALMYWHTVATNTGLHTSIRLRLFQHVSNFDLNSALQHQWVYHFQPLQEQ